MENYASVVIYHWDEQKEGMNKPVEAIWFQTFEE